jgi:hypothetical protein
LSRRDKRKIVEWKMYDDNLDEACRDLKVRYKRMWKLYATNPIFRNVVFSRFSE